MALTVDEIRIYPVKGMRGVSVPEALVEPWGLRGDRRWMVVDDRNRFLTQRQLPRMAAIAAALREGGVVLSAETFGSVEVSVPPHGAETVETIVFDDRVPAARADARAEAWLTRVLGMPCRLVFMADPEQARPVEPEFASPADRVSFADGFPLLVTTAASLTDLNRRLKAPVPMDRFRANVVVGGAAPWGEDAWRRISVGAAVFTAPKDCARCAVPTVDQDTGEKSADNEPLRTLGTFRRKARGRIIFGQNLIPEHLGRIAVGDAVAILA